LVYLTPTLSLQVARKHPPDEEDLLPALTHPLRRMVLRLHLEAKQPLSPKGLSQLTDHPVANVSYHVRFLADCGAVEVVDERPVRGSTEHFYDVTRLVKDTPWVREALGLSP
jgi:DNA-binding transcriptional ArsR family regulator